jgi:hypothetical protein
MVGEEEAVGTDRVDSGKGDDPIARLSLRSPEYGS